MRWVYILALVAQNVIGFAALAGDVDGRVTVIDGDTIDVGSTRVRLYGIDAPEAGQTCRNANGAVWRCGAWVTEVARERFQNRQARCAFRDYDRYGRVVASCLVDGEDIAANLVRDGLAFAYTRYSKAYAALETSASARRTGLHASSVQSPEAYRRNGGPEQRLAGCVIKGNIARDGTRIYHLPHQQHYARTRIDDSRGERWFCSRQDAEAAGWRAARR